ncbi:hypothetical protein DM860_002125 [Cuscuta australis]|uniref:Uncharacterized protein n=1 Tax=Cuscuta australis TaxID=267555 RepID=A0A328DVU7_9ASTE|nr:hypothetical protein DM860_002125 [Cuscuta australis]
MEVGCGDRSKRGATMILRVLVVYGSSDGARIKSGDSDTLLLSGGDEDCKGLKVDGFRLGKRMGTHSHPIAVIRDWPHTFSPGAATPSATDWGRKNNDSVDSFGKYVMPQGSEGRRKDNNNSKTSAEEKFLNSNPGNNWINMKGFEAAKLSNLLRLNASQLEMC